MDINNTGIYILSDEEYSFVIDFIQRLQTDGALRYRLWFDGFRGLFNPDSFKPAQIIRFYMLSGRTISCGNFISNIRVMSFNEYKGQIFMAPKNQEQLIGPHIPGDSKCTDMLKIIDIYNHYDSPTLHTDHFISSLQGISNLI